MTRLRRMTGLMVCGCLIWAGPVRADAVVDWNDIAFQAIVAAIAAGRPGVPTALDIATVHIAVYDAVQAIERRHEPYHVEIPRASGSPAAAAAKAAHDVLVSRFPDQTASLDTIYHSYLASNRIREDDPGVAVGQKAAAGIIALRANDRSFPPNQVPFVGGMGPGVWRPTPSYLPGPPPSLAPMLAPWLADVRPFTLTAPNRFRAEPHPDLNSARYTRDYNEVKALGGLVNSARSPAQTDLAYFWTDNFFAQWNRGIRAIANAHIRKISDSARLFALVNLALADTVLTIWDTKNHYVFWRPVTAIQEGDNDGNPRTVGDPTWQPFINTPNYPDYTSGANGTTGAITRMLELFFGTDRMTFSLTTLAPQAVQKTRTYSRFSDAAEDVVNVRIYQGIHFRFADTEGRSQGLRVAEWVFRHFLLPLEDKDDDDRDR